MELLAEFSDKDIGAWKDSRADYEVIWGEKSTAHGKDIQSYYRGAVRAIVLNSKKEMALLHATKYDYYKLPGGGL